MFFQGSEAMVRWEDKCDEKKARRTDGYKWREKWKQAISEKEREKERMEMITELITLTFT